MGNNIIKEHKKIVESMDILKERIIRDLISSTILDFSNKTEVSAFNSNNLKVNFSEKYEPLKLKDMG